MHKEGARRCCVQVCGAELLDGARSAPWENEAPCVQPLGTEHTSVFKEPEGKLQTTMRPRHEKVSPAIPSEATAVSSRLVKPSLILLKSISHALRTLLEDSR